MTLLNPLNVHNIINNELAICSGDLIDLSSDLTTIALEYRENRRPFDPNIILEALENKIGLEGTLCVRTWNWGFCRGEPFDYLSTPSEVGALGNIALKRNGYKRTTHPMYSFAVWGKHQDTLCNLHNISAWGSDSPFAFLTSNSGKQLMFGSTMYNSLTHVHYVEEMVGVSYRYLKKFTAPYIDACGFESIRTYYMNVRKLALNVKMNSEMFANPFYKAGVLETKMFNKTSISIVHLKEATEIIKDDILYNHSRNICKYKGQQG